MRKVELLLLDADGVVQIDTLDRKHMLAKICGGIADVEKLMIDLFDAELPCLTGQADFPERLQKVLADWGNRVSLEEALIAWTAIEPNAEVLDLVDSILANGTPVALASSQEAFRASYMSKELAYGSRFNHLYFSCYLRKMKPDPAYFNTIFSTLAVSPTRTLFIDDNQRLVDAAKDLGVNAFRFDLNTEPVSKLKTILVNQGLL